MKVRLIIFLLILPAYIFAQSAGESGLSFLKLGSGARNVALGDNGAIFAKDASALFYNPANLAGLKGGEVLLMHNEWIQDVRSEVIAARFVISDITFGFGVQSASVGNIEVRTKPGPSDGTISANYLALTFGGAFALGDRFNGGAAVKYVYEGIYGYSATGYAFDIGGTYKLVHGFDISASLRNIGSMEELYRQASKLPSEFRFGVLYSTQIPSAKLSLAVGSEFQKYLLQSDSHVNIGAEVVYDELIAARIGYQTMYESKNITGGVGLRWGFLRFDYAFSPFSYGLGTGHTVSLLMTF